MKHLITILLCSIILFSCKTDDNKVSKAGYWGYSIEITNKGTRSEGQWGHLFFKGKEVKGYFQSIVADTTRYDYKERTYAWDFGGYDIMQENVRPVFSSAKITGDDLKTGWYEADFTARKMNTPETWIWIKSGLLQAFLDPDKIDEFISVHRLK
jgi:hypothetical protein